jgi:hypothetical protein
VVDSIVNLSYSSTPVARGVYFMPWMNRDGKFTLGFYYEGLRYSNRTHFLERVLGVVKSEKVFFFFFFFSFLFCFAFHVDS